MDGVTYLLTKDHYLHYTGIRYYWEDHTTNHYKSIG